MHEFLESKRQFADWIKQRIVKYKFIDNEDFTIHKFVNGKATQIEYVITVGMAKELSMVENNDKGQEARRYFIACEGKLKEIDAKANLLVSIYNGGQSAIVASKELADTAKLAFSKTVIIPRFIQRNFESPVLYSEI